jgi:GNAT superfamily N-acetyltransferase
LLDVTLASMRHWGRVVGSASPGARAIERDGVVAAIVPAAPERAVANSVVYTDVAGLESTYDEVAAAYAEIGANWTVWVPPGDDEAPALLERAGHFLDAEPDAMALDLRGGVARPAPHALEDWTAQGEPADIGPINDRSYRFNTDSFTRAFARLPRDAVRVYLARRDGQPIACLVTVDLDANTEIQMVAVVPEARGDGLAGKLLAHALADAAERGQQSSTLIATRLGRPVYERLGFRPIGRFKMLERRAAT